VGIGHHNISIEATTTEGTSTIGEKLHQIFHSTNMEATTQVTSSHTNRMGAPTSTTSCFVSSGAFDAMPLNSRPLSGCKIAGGAITRTISNNALATVPA
jgi:hypothetical protein